MLSILAPLARRAALAAARWRPRRCPPAASSLSGAYLAAMQADFRDDYAEAALYYDQALALDPDNVGLLTNAVVGRVAIGDVAGARPLADRLEAADPDNQVATLVRLGDTLAAGDFAAGGRRSSTTAGRRGSTRCSAACSPAGSTSAATTSPPPRPSSTR